MTNVTYLTETASMSAQKMSEMTPRMSARSSGCAGLRVGRDLQRVERARADVAEDDADGAEGGREERSHEGYRGEEGFAMRPLRRALMGAHSRAVASSSCHVMPRALAAMRRFA